MSQVKQKIIMWYIFHGFYSHIVTKRHDPFCNINFLFLMLMLFFISSKITFKTSITSTRKRKDYYLSRKNSNLHDKELFHLFTFSYFPPTKAINDEHVFKVYN